MKNKVCVYLIILFSIFFVLNIKNGDFELYLQQKIKIDSEKNADMIENRIKEIILEKEEIYKNEKEIISLKNENEEIEQKNELIKQKIFNETEENSFQIKFYELKENSLKLEKTILTAKITQFCNQNNEEKKKYEKEFSQQAKNFCIYPIISIFLAGGGVLVQKLITNLPEAYSNIINALSLAFGGVSAYILIRQFLLPYEKLYGINKQMLEAYRGLNPVNYEEKDDESHKKINEISLDLENILNNKKKISEDYILKQKNYYHDVSENNNILKENNRKIEEKTRENKKIQSKLIEEMNELEKIISDKTNYFFAQIIIDEKVKKLEYDQIYELFITHRDYLKAKGISDVSFGLTLCNYFEDLLIIESATMREEDKTLLEKLFCQITSDFNIKTFTPWDYSKEQNIQFYGYKTISESIEKKVKEFSKSDRSYSEINKNTSSQFLLYGEPGVGKTQLCMHIFNKNKKLFEENNVILFPIKGSQINSVNDLKCLINRIKRLIVQNKKVILFSDECEAFLGNRKQADTTDEKIKMIGEMLTWFNEEDFHKNILFIGCTNELDLIDGALQRIGRLGNNTIFIGKPNFYTRQEIINGLIDQYLPGTDQNDKEKSKNYLTLLTTGRNNAEIDMVVFHYAKIFKEKQEKLKEFTKEKEEIKKRSGWWSHLDAIFDYFRKLFDAKESRKYWNEWGMGKAPIMVQEIFNSGFEKNVLLERLQFIEKVYHASGMILKKQSWLKELLTLINPVTIIKKWYEKDPLSTGTRPDLTPKQLYLLNAHFSKIDFINSSDLNEISFDDLIEYLNCLQTILGKSDFQDLVMYNIRHHITKFCISDNPFSFSKGIENKILELLNKELDVMKTEIETFFLTHLSGQFKSFQRMTIDSTQDTFSMKITDAFININQELHEQILIIYKNKIKNVCDILEKVLEKEDAILLEYLRDEKKSIEEFISKNPNTDKESYKCNRYVSLINEIFFKLYNSKKGNIDGIRNFFISFITELLNTDFFKEYERLIEKIINKYLNQDIEDAVYKASGNNSDIKESIKNCLSRGKMSFLKKTSFEKITDLIKDEDNQEIIISQLFSFMNCLYALLNFITVSDKSLNTEKGYKSSELNRFFREQISREKDIERDHAWINQIDSFKENHSCFESKNMIFECLEELGKEQVKFVDDINHSDSTIRESLFSLLIIQNTEDKKISKEAKNCLINNILQKTDLLNKNISHEAATMVKTFSLQS